MISVRVVLSIEKNKNMNIVPINSFNIYEFECDDTLTDLVLEDIKKTKLFWRSSAKLENFASNDSDVASAAYLDPKLNIPYYHEEFFSWLQQCLDDVTKIYFKNIKLVISDAWPVKTIFGQGINQHIHSNSIFSGVFYFDSFASSGTCFYQKNSTVARIEQILGVHHTNNTSDIFNGPNHFIFTSLPKKNKLVIFPSELKHSMEKHKITKTRYTFSFNSYFNGVVSDNNTTVLELKTISVKERNQRFLNVVGPTGML